jgi:hypothetical protein
MNQDEYHDRLLLEILMEDKNQTRLIGPGGFVIVDIFAVAQAANLPSNTVWISEAVKFFAREGNEWVTAVYTADGEVDVVSVTDEGRCRNGEFARSGPLT